MFQPTHEKFKKDIPLAERGRETALSIEIELIKESIDENGGTGEKWVKENGKSFREIITEHPEFIGLWGNDKEKAEDGIKELLEDSRAR